MATAKSVIDVILGEAKGGSWEDMLGVASVIYNRARDARATPEQIVEIPSQFNAYGKALPAGVGKYRSLAQKAWDQVQKTGPVHDGSYQMSGGLKPKVKGLVEVAAVPGGHVYYKDPQARPIATTEGYRKPRYTDQMKMAGGMPQLTGPASASAAGTANLGMDRTLPNVKMANAGAQYRRQPITPTLMSNINQAVENVYGPGYRAEVYSGGQPAKGTSDHRTGSVRHDDGKAGDIYIFGPDGKQIKGDGLAPLGQYWAANKIGGVGLEMKGGGIHLDEWSTPPNPKDGMFWDYRKDGGSLTAVQQAAMEEGLKGQWPQVAAFNRPPIPTPRQPMALMAQAKAADRSYNPGGIVDAKAISLNLVPSANAGEMPKITRSALPAIQERIRPMPTSAQAKTSTGVGYSLPQSRPAPLSDSAFSARYSPVQSQFAATPQRTQRALPNVAASAYSDARPMPTGTIPQRVSAPVQSTPAPRYNPLPSGPVAPSVSPATMAAAYGQYGQTRMAAPATPMRANPVAAPFTVKATAGNMTTPIPGPLSNAPIQSPVAATTGQFKKFTPIQKIQQKLKTAVEPENLKAMGGQLAGGAAGSLLGGPIGGILGGLIGKQIMSQPQGQGLLAGLFGGGGNNGYQGQSTYIGNGVNAVDRAMYGNRAGDTATYNSQGGGTVTNLGNGSSQRTSSKYGWTETTHRDGSKSISYKK